MTPQYLPQSLISKGHNASDPSRLHNVSPEQRTAMPIATDTRPSPSRTSGRGGAGHSAQGAAQIVDSDAELMLISSITNLWAIDKDGGPNLKKLRRDRVANRCELGKKLAELKASYVGCGRGGRWLPLLREIDMPRSTAEGLVKRHSSANDGKKSTHEPAQLTEDSLHKLLKNLKPKLVPVNTRELANVFLFELAILLDGQIAQRALPTSIVGENELPASAGAVATSRFPDIVSVDDL